MRVFMLILTLVVFSSSGFASTVSLTMDLKICRLFKDRNIVELDNFLSGYVKKLPGKWLFRPADFSECSRRAIGMWYYVKGNYGEAIKWLKSVRSSELMDVVNLSAALIKDGKLDKAESLIKKASVKYGNEKHLLFNLALVYIKKGDYKLARKKLITILNSPDVDKSLKSKALDILGLIGY